MQQDAIRQYQELMNSVNKMYMNMIQGYMQFTYNLHRMNNEQIQEYINEQNALLIEWSRLIMAKPRPLIA